jgi:hypothetical protein
MTLVKFIPDNFLKLNQETEGEAVYKRSLVSPMVMFSFVITIVGCQTAIEVKRFQ